VITPAARIYVHFRGNGVNNLLGRFTTLIFQIGYAKLALIAFCAAHARSGSCRDRNTISHCLFCLHCPRLNNGREIDIVVVVGWIKCTRRVRIKKRVSDTENQFARRHRTCLHRRKIGKWTCATAIRTHGKVNFHRTKSMLCVSCILQMVIFYTNTVAFLVNGYVS
jgi:hypothetical protein